MSLIDIIHEKQKEGKTLLIAFKNSSNIYMTPQDSIETISEDFCHVRADVSIKGSVDAIYNIKDIVRVSIVKG
jgi:hypothetical protein